MTGVYSREAGVSVQQLWLGKCRGKSTGTISRREQPYQLPDGCLEGSSLELLCI